ncbi:hypothetical protein NE237_018097 [Protea cynaroides]|uniref:Uncharacterized protein n=1 Tax=Protea cynaroides TaxID=273540 RepID=A0A9Q0K988_9MAGN|nr:hypothetical protein NE237_018097 [Protea cynaroides]
MEERKPSTKEEEPPQTHRPPQETFGSGTYVVQVPKDQIYRIPPPENAAYLQRLKSNQNQPKKSSFCSCIVYILLVIFILALVLLLILGIFYLFHKPQGVNHSSHLVIHHPMHHQIINSKGTEDLERKRVQLVLSGLKGKLPPKVQKILKGKGWR